MPAKPAPQKIRVATVKLSHDVKESLKTALAMTIAYGISLQMGWDKPMWAGFAIAFVSLATVGQSTNKALLRMAGTLVAAVIALTLIGLFAQQRWLFITFVSLWFGLCAYMNAGTRAPYFWFVAAFVSLIICVDGGPNPAQAFSIAMLRLEQTGLGIAVYSVISILLWPNNSRASFVESTRKLAQVQRDLLRKSLQSAIKPGQAEEIHSLRAQEIAALNQTAALMAAAITDSDEVREMKTYWQRYLQAVKALAENMQQWRDNLNDLHKLPLAQLLPRLHDFSGETDERLAGVEKMLGGAACMHTCKDGQLNIDASQTQALSHFNRAALLTGQHHLSEIDAHSRSLFENVAVIGGFGAASTASAPHEKIKGPAFTPDPDRLWISAKVMLLLWAAFLCVVYISDFPGGWGFVSMCGPIGLIMLGAPQLSVRLLFKPVFSSILFAGSLYILLMPGLSSFLGLGSMIFTATFVICYRFAQPQQMLGRAFGLAILVVLMGVSNQQTYSFLSVANTALMFATVFLLIAIISYLPFSPLPERALLRLLKRYFNSASYALLQHTDTTTTPISSALKRIHRQNVAILPAKMLVWADYADPGVLGAENTAEIPVMVGTLQALSYRMEALQHARDLPQSPHLESVLIEQMQTWRSAIATALAGLARDPADYSILQRSRLEQMLATLERDITLAMSGIDISDTERENLYNLLGAYRGTSEALLDFTETAANIDWKPWYEERFA